MSQTRRALLAVPLALPAIARAQAWPTRPVRIVVGFLAGGSNDIMARLLAAHLTEAFPGSRFVVENRAGAGTLIATEHVARSAADGHTLLYGSASNVIASLVNRKAGINVAQEFSAVALATSLQLLVLARADSPIRSVPDLIAAAKREPGRLTISHPGTGGANHLSLVLLMRQAGIEITPVPFVGNPPSLNAGVRGDVDLVSDSVFGARAYMQSGQLRPIGFTGAHRVPSFPEVPIFAETLPGYEVVVWSGLLAPRGTPESVLEALNAATNAALRRPDIMERIQDFGSEPMGGSRAEFTRLIASETERWGQVIRALNMTTD